MLKSNDQPARLFANSNSLASIASPLRANRYRREIRTGISSRHTMRSPRRQFAACNKPSAPKNAVLYPAYVHELLPGMHYRVFEFRTP
jgi:hypothetical protein